MTTHRQKVNDKVWWKDETDPVPDHRAVNIMDLAGQLKQNSRARTTNTAFMDNTQLSKYLSYESARQRIELEKAKMKKMEENPHE